MRTVETLLAAAVFLAARLAGAQGIGFIETPTHDETASGAARNTAAARRVSMVLMICYRGCMTERST